MLLIRFDNVVNRTFTQGLVRDVRALCGSPQVPGDPTWPDPLVVLGSRRREEDDRRIVVTVEPVAVEAKKWKKTLREKFAARLHKIVALHFDAATEIWVVVRGFESANDAIIRGRGKVSHLRQVGDEE